jgi:hypothetical protein
VDHQSPVSCSSSSAVLSREKVPHRCSTVYMVTACRSTRPLWMRCQMDGSVSALRACYVADLRLAAWARCFGPESSSLPLAALRNQSPLSQWQEAVLQDRA